MFTKEKLEELIELDGGVFWGGYGDSHRIGWRYEEPSIEEQKEVESKFGVSYWSKYLLDSYAGKSAESLNRVLRNASVTPKDDLHRLNENYLNEVLDEIPSFDNKVVYRWTWFDDDEAKYLKKYVGKLIMRPDFTSASKFKNISHSYFYEIKTCENSNCRDIEDIVKKEKHVLFKSKTVFKIISFDGETFYLEEKKENKWDLVLGDYFWESNRG